MENPYQSPESFEQAELNEILPATKMPGMRRSMFWVIVIVLRITETAAITSLDVSNYYPAWVLLISFVFLITCAILTYFRLLNIGGNPRWCFLVLVPVLNIPIFVRCLIFPAGYALTKKLDMAAKVIVVLVVVAFVVVIGLVVLTLLDSV